MKKITIEQCQDFDVNNFISNIRDADKKEAYAIGLRDIENAVSDTVHGAYISLVARDSEGRILCVFGVSSSIHKEYGRGIWLLGTNILNGYHKEFVYYSKIIIKELLKNNGRLYNYISVDNKMSVRWLKKLGAKFSAPVKINGNDFMLFIIE